MLTGELQSQTLPYLRPHDKVSQALQLMNDNQVTHLPIVDGDKYIGIISEDDLLLAENDHTELNALQQSFGNISVKNNEHFLKAIQLAAENGLSVVPVVDNENDIVGAVTYTDLLRHASEFMSLREPGGLIVLEMQGNQYSFNEISKLVAYKSTIDKKRKRRGKKNIKQQNMIRTSTLTKHQNDIGGAAETLRSSAAARRSATPRRRLQLVPVRRRD